MATTYDTCESCGKPIAATIEPLCCECRYGKAPTGHTPEEPDICTFMQINPGRRIAEGSSLPVGDDTNPEDQTETGWRNLLSP